MLVLGAIVLATIHSDARAQEMEVLEIGATEFESVDFDVPVTVKLEWPASIRAQTGHVDFPEIERRLKVYRLASRRAPQLVRYPAEDEDPCQPYGCWEDESRSVTTRADSTGLHVVLGRLRANRYYHVRFLIRRSLTEREEEVFLANAVGALDRNFRDGIPGSLDEVRRKEIQRAMVEAVREATDMEVSPTRGSFFDDTLSDAELPAASASVFDTLYANLGMLAVFSSPTNRESNARNLSPGIRSTGALFRATDALERLGHLDSTLTGLHLFVSELRIDERRSGITRSVVVDSLHLLSEAGYRLGIMEKSVRAGLAIGRYALSKYGHLSRDRGPVTEIWTPEQMEARTRNIDTTVHTLERLVYVVDQIRHLSEYRGSSQGRTIGDAELQALRERLAAARDALRRVPREDAAFLALQVDLARRQAIFERFAEEALTRFSEAEVYATASSTANFRTRANMYISADLGLVHVPGFNDVSPYVGVNIYPFPVNKEAALRSFGFGESMLRRAAFMVGVTATSVERGDLREGAVGDRGLLAGIGVRVTDAVRVSTGALYFYEVDPDDLVRDRSLSRSAFVSISVDWDVKESLGGLRDAIF
jgi:hypothetical protein